MAQKEDQDHRQRAEHDAHQAGEHDVRRAGDEENSAHQRRMQQAPVVLPSPQVPQPWAVREPDLFGEVSDLPVVVRIGEAVPGVFRIGDKEEVAEPRDERDRSHRSEPGPGRRGREDVRSLFDAWRRGRLLPIELVLVGEDPREPQLHAVAASAATRSCERATSRIARSRTSVCRSQSNRRAHSKARSPVAWFSSGSSSSAMIPAA